MIQRGNQNSPGGPKRAKLMICDSTAKLGLWSRLSTVVQYDGVDGGQGLDAQA